MTLYVEGAQNFNAQQKQEAIDILRQLANQIEANNFTLVSGIVPFTRAIAISYYPNTITGSIHNMTIMQAP